MDKILVPDGFKDSMKDNPETTYFGDGYVVMSKERHSKISDMIMMLTKENSGLSASLGNFNERLSEAPELTLELVEGDDDEWILEEVGSRNPIYKFFSDDKRFVKAVPYKPMTFAIVEVTDV